MALRHFYCQNVFKYFSGSLYVVYCMYCPSFWMVIKASRHFTTQYTMTPQLP